MRSIEVSQAIAAMVGGSGAGGLDSGMLLIVTILQVIIGAGIYVWLALALSAVFRKTGIAPWKAWVPVLNMWELFALAGMRPWWSVVLAGGAVLVAIVTGVITGALAGAALAAGFSGDASGALAAVTASVVVPGLIWLAFAAFAVVVHAKMLARLGRGFGLGRGFVVLGVLLFPAWASIVGWGAPRWIGPRRDQEPALFGDVAEPARPAADRAAGAPVAPTAAPPAAPGVPASAAFAPAPFGGGAAPTADAAPPAPASSAANPWAPPPPPAYAAPSAPAPSPQPQPHPPAAAPAQQPAPVAHPAAASVAGIPAASDELDERTVLAARRAPAATLRLPGGQTVALTGDAVVLGRNPLAPDDAPAAQVVSVDDATRTVSKTHALLRRTPQGWTITDLASTNGVFVGESEDEVTGTAPVSGLFHLGDAELAISEA
ncbi:DUF5684 domain-containing protein [Microbacterium radiodurans]|uniref:FHA domain-containing protein n=1 Tax=Microbacterium radiodurans TaxID=661398 RepID=A0A5J5IRQ1_9MICO|nr:DUF5684 domain-containing protein [Microbacterium radiodurans]KAA9086558.1 FHA domain-containing protein [Microbacterium radiodurans]